MVERSDRVSQAARDAIGRVLREHLVQYGYRECSVAPGLDHDGDPVLFVHAKFDLVHEPIDPGFTVGITGYVPGESGERYFLAMIPAK